MEFKPAKCPSCGGDLQLPTNKENVKCMYCGCAIVVKEAISLAGGFNVESVLDLAQTAYEGGNYEKAIQFYDKALSADSKNAKAWFYKGLCLLELSGFVSGHAVLHKEIFDLLFRGRRRN